MRLTQERNVVTLAVFFLAGHLKAQILDSDPRHLDCPPGSHFANGRCKVSVRIRFGPAHTGVNRPEPVPSPTSVLPFVTSPKPPAIVSITTKQPATFQEDPCPLGYKLTAGKCRPSYLHNKWHPYSHLPFYQPINFGNFHSPLYPLFHHPANSCWQSSPLAYNNKYWGYPYYGGGYPHSALYGLQPWLNKFCPPGYHVLHGRCEPPQRVSISMNPS